MVAHRISGIANSLHAGGERMGHTMDINELSPPAREVVDFLNSHDFRFVARCSVDFEVKMIHDIETAVHFAGSDEITHSQFTFGDVKQLAMADVRARIDTTSPELSSGIVNMLGDAGIRLRRRLPKAYRDLAGDIAADLIYATIARAAEMPKDTLFERMFQLYRCGYWPCGWVGDFPSGHLCAFSESPAPGGESA